MDILRRGFDLFYSTVRPFVFHLTRYDPETAHSLFVDFCDYLHKAGLERFVLDNSANRSKLPFELSNAAGFNKNGEIHPSVMKYLGFDWVVVGTVTKDAWKGNPRPRVLRYPETGSMLNWLGLPGEGAEAVAERIGRYGNHGVPITVNFAPTPDKRGDGCLRDLESTVLALRHVPFVDRFELNISCPNAYRELGGSDSRKDYEIKLDEMLDAVDKVVLPRQPLYIKVSPDIDEITVSTIIGVSGIHSVSGFTVSNTTTHHDASYIRDSPRKGGASGNALYSRSLDVQKIFLDNFADKKFKIIACGGIDSADKVKERLSLGASGIQVYTPFIFKGPRLLRVLRCQDYG